MICDKISLYDSTKRGFVMIQSADLRSTLYTLINTISGIICLLYSYFTYKKRKEKLGDAGTLLYGFLSNRAIYFKKDVKKIIYSGILFFEITIFALLQPLPMLVGFPRVFGNLTGTGASYFGTIVMGLILIPLFSLILWTNLVEIFDHITPAYPLSLVVLKISCALAGCCHGVEWEYGIFNYKYGRAEVPIQLIEAAVALAIFFFLLHYKKKAKPGTMFPMYIIAYSSTRFFTEFLRTEENILGPFKNYQIQCFIFVIIGVVLYFVAVKKGNKIVALFETKTYFKQGKLHEKVLEIKKQLANPKYKKPYTQRRRKPVIK